jgi:hypothetical protein
MSSSIIITILKVVFYIAIVCIAILLLDYEYARYRYNKLRNQPNPFYLKPVKRQLYFDTIKLTGLQNTKEWELVCNKILQEYSNLFSFNFTKNFIQDYYKNHIIVEIPGKGICKDVEALILLFKWGSMRLVKIEECRYYFFKSYYYYVIIEYDKITVPLEGGDVTNCSGIEKFDVNKNGDTLRGHGSILHSSYNHII